MNTLQNVYNKLSDKTELAKHEVELSLLDDIKKSENNLLDGINSVVKERAIIESTKIKMGQEIDKVKFLVDNLEKNLNKFNAQAKDLGITQKPNEIEKAEAMIISVKKDVQNITTKYLK